MSRLHRLKTWPEFFEAIADGSKTFELRRNDRDFAVGDLLELVEFILDTRPNYGGPTGRVLTRRITYVLADAPQWGLAPGFAILGLALTSLEPTND